MSGKNNTIQILFSNQDLNTIKEYAVRYLPKNKELTRDQLLICGTIYAINKLLQERGIDKIFDVIEGENKDD